MTRTELINKAVEVIRDSMMYNGTLESEIRANAEKMGNAELMLFLEIYEAI